MEPPLVAHIMGGNMLQIQGSQLILNGYTLSFDPLKAITDKTDLSFQWMCPNITVTNNRRLRRRRLNDFLNGNRKLLQS